MAALGIADTANEVSVFELASKAVALAAAAGGGLFIMGWSYANAYFKMWGIPFVSLNIPRDFIVSYGAIAIFNQPTAILVFLFTIILVGSVIIFGARKWAPGAVSWLLLLYLVVIFLACGGFGRWSAEQSYKTMQQDGFFQLPRLIVNMKQDWMKGDSSERAKILRRELSEVGCYREVFIGTDTIWLARPYQGVVGSPSAEAPGVLGLQSKDVDAVRVLSGRENCP